MIYYHDAELDHVHDDHHSHEGDNVSVHGSEMASRIGDASEIGNLLGQGQMDDALARSLLSNDSFLQALKNKLGLADDRITVRTYAWMKCSAVLFTYIRMNSYFHSFTLYANEDSAPLVHLPSYVFIGYCYFC